MIPFASPPPSTLFLFALWKRTCLLDRYLSRSNQWVCLVILLLLERENCETMVFCKSWKELNYPLVFWSADSHALTSSDISCFLNSVILVVHKGRKISKLCRHTWVPDHMTLTQKRLLVRQLTDPRDTKIILKTYVILCIQVRSIPVAHTLNLLITIFFLIQISWLKNTSSTGRNICQFLQFVEVPSLQIILYICTSSDVWHAHLCHKRSKSLVL